MAHLLLWLAGVNPPDHSLAQRAALGDRHARDQLLTRHYEAIRRLCQRLCGDPERAEDVAQETFAALLRALDSYRGAASFTTWAYTVARTHHGRAIRSEMRHRARAARLHAHLGSLLVSADDGEAALACASLRHWVDRATRQLSEVDRAVLVLRDVQGYTAAEAAQALGLTVPAVKARLSRARARVRQQIPTEAAA